MTPFLKIVAENLYEKYGNDLSDIAIVFPNKRAALFLNEQLAQIAQRPIWSPTYITISELFGKHSNLKIADPIKLVCDLHKSFVSCTGIDETLDHFYGWGQLLISDFDDLDKHMADAEKVFANLRDIHELDDVSYLSDEQKRMIQKFFSNFSDDHNSELKKRFLQLWSHFLDIYQDFNARLASQGLAYEGALYRQVATDDSISFEHSKYIFVGFNMMQEVELRLCDRLVQEGKAAFFWDCDHYYMSKKQEAGYYVRQYMQRFPSELGVEVPSLFLKKKDVTYISAPTENAQARYVNEWLQEDNRYKKGHKVAIVLADESLLPAVIHSLPENLPSVNITIGYPLHHTPFFSLVQQLIQLQGIGHPKSSDTYRLHYVLLALRHPYARYISGQYTALLADLEARKRFYPTRESLVIEEDEGLSLLFRNLDDAPDTDAYNMALISYLVDVLKMIGSNARDVDDPLFHESLYRSYTLLNRLRGLIESQDLKVDTITLERLILQLFQTTNIPFHGEPVKGVQIMGILETRNLDFEHILVLSCNEGNLPKGVNDASFIPYSIRKAYGLTTIDNKVAIYAYYFYRMLQRSTSVTLTYNNSTEDGQTGEMSRFMLQMLVETNHKVKRRTLVAGQTPRQSEFADIAKTDDMLGKLDEIKLLTPTLLNAFMRCQKRFYYKYVENLDEPDEIDEDEVDNRVFGNIFHRAAELFYLHLASASCITTDSHGKQCLSHPVVVGKDSIENALKDDALIYRLVDQAFCEELFKVDTHDYHPQYNGLQLINKEVIANYLKQLLVIDSRQAPFTIIGLEIVVSTEIDVPLRNGTRRFRIGGFIDRLDAVAANGNPGVENLMERIRVIDYKTGRAVASHPKDLAEIFNSEMLHKHTDYYLQAMLYSFIVKNDARLNPARDPVSPGLLFIQNARAEGYDPTLTFGRGEKILDVAPYEEEFMGRITGIISDIYDTSQPFSPTSDRQRCNNCPYAGLCK